jgi:hypothetical protein
MKAVGDLDHITGDYSQDTFNLCGDASVWLANKLITKEKDIFITVGDFKHLDHWTDHLWVEWDEFIIDLTLAQFISNSPKIAVVEKTNKLYKKIKRYTPLEFLDKAGIKKISKKRKVYKLMMCNIMERSEI